MRTGASSTASWRRPVVSAALAAALATAAPAPARAALVCEPVGEPVLAEQADVVFTGRVLKSFDDRSAPAPWVKPLLAHWPAFVPIPTVQDPRAPGIPATSFEVENVYKGDVPGDQVTVHLLGRVTFAHGEYTVFANRSQQGLFTTECSGDLRGPIDPHDYHLGAARKPAAAWWQLLVAPVAALLAVLLGAAAAAGGNVYLARRRAREPR